MKWIFSLSMLVLPLWIFGQNGTTLEEYRYLSKGYAYQLEMGLDAHKEGYRIQKLFRSDQDVQFVGLYKQTATPLRALLAIIDASKAQPKYLCIPNETADESVRQLYKKAKQEILASSSAREQFEEALTILLMRSLDQPITSYPHRGQQEELVSKGAPIQSIELTSKGIPINQQPVYERAPQVQARDIPQSMDHHSARTETGNLKVSTLIGGELTDRLLVEAPEITIRHRSKGKVVVKLCVDLNGAVTQAKFTQKGSTTLDSGLKQIALENARSLQFGISHLREQCGTIAYHFH